MSLFTPPCGLTPWFLYVPRSDNIQGIVSTDGGLNRAIFLHTLPCTLTLPLVCYLSEHRPRPPFARSHAVRLSFNRTPIMNPDFFDYDLTMRSGIDCMFSGGGVKRISGLIYGRVHIEPNSNVSIYSQYSIRLNHCFGVSSHVRRGDSRCLESLLGEYHSRRRLLVSC